MNHVRKVLHFAAVSGAGLTLDICLFLAVLSLKVPAFAANAASSFAAVTFVYFASVRRVFRYGGEFHVAMFATYAAYQACSWAVQALIALGLPGAAAKLAIVPLTFTANYLFMAWLTSNPGRWSREVGS